MNKLKRIAARILTSLLIALAVILIVSMLPIPVPYAGYLVAGMQTSYSLLAMVVIPAIVIIFDQASRIIKEVKRLKNENVQNII